MNSEIEEKTERLCELLKANGLAGVLLNAQHNFTWLTAGGSNGIDLSRDNGASFLFVRADGKRFLIANNIELSRMLAEEVSEHDFEPVELPWQIEKAPGDAILTAANSLMTGGGEIAADINFSANVRAVEGLISTCRFQLTEAEVERYQQLGRDAGEALMAATVMLSPGESEIEIACKVRNELAKYNVFSVVTLAGADERIEQYRHPVPTENVWKQTLLIAVCARRHGLIASLSRMVCIGDVPSELQRRTEAAAAVNAKLQAATLPGAKASDLYQIAASAYADLGFAEEINKHHQGGACGYRTRDWLVHPANSETVKPNQAFAWNPSITGTKTEVTGIVREGRFEAITPAGGFPQIVTSIDGREHYSPGILSLSKGASA
jgi:antitoxin VapB